MERKKVDKELLEKQTRILKDRIQYNEQKKVAIKENFSRIDQDLSTVRARLIPVEEYKATRAELATEVVEEILNIQLDYQSIGDSSLEQVENQPDMKPMTLPEILKNCKLNREILNTSVGGGLKVKFERIKAKRHLHKMSRYSSISQLPGHRSVTFSTDLRDPEGRVLDTPVP